MHFIRAFDAISGSNYAVSPPDFNLLLTLDVLLAEGSVARAARRLRLSPSAMSRALARLRETTGDPLLVRAGRGLVPTPRALELRERVSQLVQGGNAVLSLSKSSTSTSFCERSRCGPAKDLWRTSDRTSLLASAGKPLACACASCRNQTKKARRFATEPLIWKLV